VTRSSPGRCILPSLLIHELELAYVICNWIMKSTSPEPAWTDTAPWHIALARRASLCVPMTIAQADKFPGRASRSDTCCWSKGLSCEFQNVWICNQRDMQLQASSGCRRSTTLCRRQSQDIFFFPSSSCTIKATGIIAGSFCSCRLSYTTI